MKKSSKLTILTMMVMLAWLIITFIFAVDRFHSVNFWCAIGFGVLAFVITIVSYLMILPKETIDIIEINAIPVVVTYIYLGAALVLNTIALFSVSLISLKFLVAFNIVFIVVFVSFRIFTNSYGRRIHSDVRITEEKKKPVILVKTRMSDLIAQNVDNDLKKAFMELKELVDYSDNLSNSQTANIEELFCAQISDIIYSLKSNESKEVILSKVENAKITWKSRNTIKATVQRN